ncbi:MAG: hypothetical protein LBR26_09940, partial [Prevotella sp.]|nr:hypothetical protein [Prevotella sp.]
LEEIRVICRFGHVYRKINGNEVDIAGFYFELPGKKNTLPIVKNYVGCHDCELMEIIGNIHENQNNAPKEPCKTNII